MSVNPDIVRARCAEIDQAVTRLEELRSLSREVLLANQDLLDVACYRLLVDRGRFSPLFSYLRQAAQKDSRRVCRLLHELARSGIGLCRVGGPAQTDGTLSQSAHSRVLENRLRAGLRDSADSAR